jgi:predicted enzyme related to lactoylglutathione lyase
MAIRARYVHTNIVANHWKRLSRFYEEVFGCTRVLPERELSGKWLEEATRIPNAHIRGIHLRLPGHGPEGPTLEIFQYDRGEEGTPSAVNRAGFAHIAFAVDDVPSALLAMKAAGGEAIGAVVSLKVPGAGTVTIVYAKDPEGNIVELQKWSLPSES